MSVTRPKPPPASAAEIADRLHSAAIHLLRRLRRTDSAAGLTAPQLSVLSVLVFGGAMNLTDLAAAEQVRAPTMSRLVSDLVALGLVERTTSTRDARAVRIAASDHGRGLLDQGRNLRLGALTRSVQALSPEEQALLAQAVGLLSRIASEKDPGQAG